MCNNTLKENCSPPQMGRLVFVGVGSYLQMCHFTFRNDFIQCSFDPFKAIFGLYDSKFAFVFIQVKDCIKCVNESFSMLLILVFLMYLFFMKLSL